MTGAVEVLLVAGLPWLSLASVVTIPVIVVDGLFTERVGYLGQVVVAIVVITDGVASRIGLGYDMPLPVVVFDIFLPQGIFHSKKMFLFIEVVNGLVAGAVFLDIPVSRKI